MNEDNTNRNSYNMNNDILTEDGVAIVGLGFRIPTCENGIENDTPNKLWHNLVNGFDAVKESSSRWSDNYNKLGEINNCNAALLSIEDMESFDPLFFGIAPSEAPLIDPQQRLLLKCVWEALEDSLIDPISVRGTNASVFIGNSYTDYREVCKNEIKSNIFGSTAHTIPNRVSYCFDLHGPSITVDTACSSSMNAIILGYKSIKQDNSNLSIVGGVNLIMDTTAYEGYTKLNMASKIGKCMVFDESADGFVRCESVGVVVLKDLKQAIQDGNKIYCVIDGASTNFDGVGIEDKQSFYGPSSLSQADNIRLALQSTNGKISAGDIDFVEAHGTGTPTGDPIETEALSMMFKENHSSSNPLLIGSIKSNIGHSESSSGVSSLIKCCLMFKNRCFAPNIHFNKPNSNIKFDEWNVRVCTKPTPFKENKKTSMVVNNFGVTGANCCLILSQLQHGVNKIESTNIGKYLIPMSANSVESLKKYQSLIIGNKHFESNNKFGEFVKSQIFSKSLTLDQRSVFIADNWNSLNQVDNQIKYETSNSKSSNITIINDNPLIVFIFCGQGSQYNTMALELYNSNQTFKQSMDNLDVKLSKYYGHSILEKLRSIDDKDNKSIHDHLLAQPATIMVQISLFELYKKWGINPSFIVGHSMGEITSSYCSGMIDLDTLCYLIYVRSVAQSKTLGSGKMLSVNISSDQFKNNYSSRYPTIEIACYNSSQSIVVAGNEIELTKLMSEFKEEGEFSTMLGSLSSFHTSSQNMIKDEVINFNIESKLPSIPTFSTVTTNLFDSSVPFNSQYVFDNIRKPVKFTDTISNLYQHIESNKLGSNVVFVEIAPHPTLLFYLKQMVPKESTYFKNGSSISIYSPLHKKKNDTEEIQKMISQLYCQDGYNGINFKCQFDETILSNEIELPLYQWDDKHYWINNSVNSKAISVGPPIDILGNSINDVSPLYQTFIDIDKEPFRYLKGHFVNNAYYFPGTGYIDNILKLYPSQDITIDTMEFKSPFILLGKGIYQCLQSTVSQTGKSQYRALFHYKDNKTNNWIQSATSNFQLFKHGGEKLTTKLNVDDLISQCNLSTVSWEDFYPFLSNKYGLGYQGIFQNTVECYIGQKQVVTKVSTELLKGFHDQKSFFNAPLLDVCLHGMSFIIEEKCQILFEKIEGFRYYSSNIPSDRNNHPTIYVNTLFKLRLGNSFYSSVTVMLEDGTVLIEIDNVVMVSISEPQDTLLIEETEYTFTSYLQSKDSLIPTPSFFKSILNQDGCITMDLKDSNEKYELFISTSLLNNIVKRCPELTIDLINSMSMEELKQKYCTNLKHERLFNYVFETIKKCGNKRDDEPWKELIIVNNITKSSKINAKTLFPLESDDESTDTLNSILEDGSLDIFYNVPYNITASKIVAETVGQIIRPLVYEKLVFRILEFGGGIGSLSVLVVDKINSILEEYPDFEIDIEYTWTDISNSFIQNAKTKLSHLNERVSIIFSTLDLELPLFEKQDINPSYYDLVIMSNVLHLIKDVKFGLDQIYKALTPNGHLLFTEIPYKSPVADGVISVFEQWWSFDELKTDRCNLPQSTWKKLLEDCNFSQDILMSKDLKNTTFSIQAQKPSLILEQPPITKYDQIIIYGSNESVCKLIENHYNQKQSTSKIHFINSIDEFNDLSSLISNESIIYFIKSMDQLDIDNYKSITFEYIQISRSLAELKSNCKHVLFTYESQEINYLASSLIGAARYFDEIPQLQLLTIDFDNKSFENKGYSRDGEIFSMVLNNLIDNGKEHVQIEYFIRNGLVYFERFKKVSKQLKSCLPTNSFNEISERNRHSLYAKLDKSGEYHLKSKQIELGPNQVEVEIKAHGVNYKDYLMLSGLVDDLTSQHLDYINAEPGLEFSGVVTRVGEHSGKEFKLGDLVYGAGTISSHIIVDSSKIYHKPSNITHIEAAVIPTVFTTSLHSIYGIGNLRNDESILIHSASGGVGLSSLEILKWKGHNGPVFVTIGSEEKKQFLIENYGNLITGYYSTRDKCYSKQIVDKLKELDIDGLNECKGVDLILNTLSSEYMDSNFSCLNVGGRIIDLSITHLKSDEFTNNNKFKFNNGYINYEALFINKKTHRYLMKTISNAIESGELNYKLPITKFSNSNIVESLEYINQRKHIGKIVVDHDIDIVGKLIKEKPDISILKSDYHIDPNNLGKTILVTGQSGIVLQVLKWIIKFLPSIENVIILSRSSMKWEMELLMNKNKQINFIFKSVDVGDTEQVNESLDEIFNENQSITNIDSIFHFAFSPISRKLNEIDIDSLDISHGAKTMGAINLHNQSIQRSWKLINFIMASSVGAINASMTDQCSYISSCCVIDAFSKYRKSLGLPVCSVNIGAIGDTGYLIKNKSTEMKLGSQGITSMPINQFLGSLDLVVQYPTKIGQLLFCRYDFQLLKNLNRPIHQKFDFYFNSLTSCIPNSVIDQSTSSFKEQFINKIAELLSIDVSKLNLDIKLLNYGADSILNVSLKSWVDKEYLPNLVSLQQIQTNPIITIYQIIIDNMEQKKKEIESKKSCKTGSFSKSIKPITII